MAEQLIWLEKSRSSLEHYRRILASFEREVAVGQLKAGPELIEKERSRLRGLVEDALAIKAACEAELASVADLTEAQQVAYVEYRNGLLPPGLARMAATGIKIIFLIPGKKTVINPDGDDATAVVINNSGVKPEDWVD